LGLRHFLALVAVHYFYAPRQWERKASQPLTTDNFEQEWSRHCTLAVGATIKLELTKLRRQTQSRWLARQTVWTLMTAEPLNIFWAQMLASRFRKRTGLTKRARAMLDSMYSSNLGNLLRSRSIDLARRLPSDRQMGWAEFWRPTGTIPVMDPQLIRTTLFDFASLLTDGLVEMKNPQNLIWREHLDPLTPANFSQNWCLHCAGSVVAGVMTLRERICQLVAGLDTETQLPSVWELVAGSEHTKFAQGILTIFRSPLAGHSRHEMEQLLKEHDRIVWQLARHFILRTHPTWVMPLVID
jgi:hypothetical protein